MTGRRWFSTAFVGTAGLTRKDLLASSSTTPQAVASVEEEGKPLPAEVATILPGDDISSLIRQGITIDDDNQPAPENEDRTTTTNNDMYGEWGFDGLCPRRQKGLGRREAQLPSYNGSFDAQSLFEHLYPTKWLKEVLIVKTNKRVGGSPLTYGEFLRWIGLWMVMACHKGYTRRDYWSTSAITMYSGALHRFLDLMSRNRFEDILTAISYTTNETNNEDRFWEVREMLTSWNKNMADNFRPSGMSCLDESMSVWSNMYRCPGFMYVPRKPHPFGNKYHSVACGKSRLMYQVELVEGKDAPRGASKEFDDRGGKTVGLLL
jgi:Transposase IS4